MGALSRLKPSPERVLPPVCGSFLLRLPPRGPRENPGTPPVSAFAPCRRATPEASPRLLPRLHSRKLGSAHRRANSAFVSRVYAQEEAAGAPVHCHVS